MSYTKYLLLSLICLGIPYTIEAGRITIEEALQMIQEKIKNQNVQLAAKFELNKLLAQSQDGMVEENDVIDMMTTMFNATTITNNQNQFNQQNNINAYQQFGNTMSLGQATRYIQQKISNQANLEEAIVDLITLVSQSDNQQTDNQQIDTSVVTNIVSTHQPQQLIPEGHDPYADENKVFEQPEVQAKLLENIQQQEETELAQAIELSLRLQDDSEEKMQKVTNATNNDTQQPEEQIENPTAEASSLLKEEVKEEEEKKTTENQKENVRKSWEQWEENQRKKKD